jgi:hypothetical protein
MTKLLKGVLVGLVIAGLSGCAPKTDDIEVEAYKVKDINMDNYKTYHIIEGSGVIDDSKGTKMTDSATIDAEIHKILVDELEKKGKSAVAQNPDLYVAYAAGTDTDVVKDKVDAEGDERLDNASEAGILLILIDAKWSTVSRLNRYAHRVDSRMGFTSFLATLSYGHL